jgi:orotidine-5'-phosphate decarboxylase
MNPRQIVLSIDTSDLAVAEHLIQLSKDNQGSIVKFGLEFSSAFSWKECARLAQKYSIDWIADAKLDDIPHTVEMAVTALCNLTPRPLGITVHVKAGEKTLESAQFAAHDTIIFGVTELTSIPVVETEERYGVERTEFVTRLIHDAKKASVKGVVVAGAEIELAKQHGLMTLVPGVRSLGAKSDDQSNTVTPYQALKSGADYIVIGREITKSPDPDTVYRSILAKIS